jgi:copper(I)-binding protein
MLKQFFLLAALCAAALNAGAHEYQADQLHIDHPWSRAMPPVAPAIAAYFVVHNQGRGADRLVGVDTPIAARAELHEHLHDADGMLKMRQVQGVEVPAGGEARFVPGGYHVMLFELNRHPALGERFPLTLHFEKAGDLQVEVAVQADAPAKSAPGMKMEGGHKAH